MNIKKGLMYVFGASGIGFLINLITSFVLPKLLPIESYSDIKLYQLYITYIGILHFGFSDGMYLRLGGKNIKEVNKEELVSEFNTFKIFQLLVQIIALLLSIITRNRLLFLVSISIIPVNVINYLRSLYQATGLYDLYSKFLTINNIMLFAINMILLLCFKVDNPIYYIIGQIIVYYVNWVLIESIIRIKIFKKVKKVGKIDYLIRDIREGFLLMLGNFCNVVFTSIDRMFSKYWLGTIQFALYSFAVSVEGLLNVFVTPVVITMYNYLCNNNEKEKILKIKKLLIVATTMILSAAFPVKWIVTNYITKYHSSVEIVFVLFLAQYYSIIVRCIHNNLYKAEKRQKKYFLVIILVSFIAFILDFLGGKVYLNNISFATATCIVSIIWFCIGENDFKDSQLDKRVYFFMATISMSYLITGILINNAVMGFLIYCLSAFSLVLVFMKEEAYYFQIQVKNFLGRRKTSK